MGGQVNVRLGDEDDAALTRCAGERGVERAALVKLFVQECLAAWHEKRTIFDRPKQLGPGDVVAFGTMLERALMEIDRIAVAWAAHESEMHKLERDDQLALTRARTEFIKGMPERITASLNPIRAEMATFSERIDRQPRLDSIDKKQAELVEAVRGNTEAIKEVRNDPRTVTGLVLGDDRVWSTAFICLFSLLTAGIGSSFIIGLSMSVPALGIPLAHKMASGDAEFCRLIRYRFEVDRCQVPTSHRIDAAAAPDAASGKSSRTTAGAASAKAKRS